MRISLRIATALATVACSSVSAFLGAYLAVCARSPEGLQQRDATSADRLSVPLGPQVHSFGEDALTAEPSAPRRLPASITAAALRDPESPQDDPIRALVHNEIPNATPEELDGWSEALHGLELPTAREILRVRNAIGKTR